MGGLCAGRPGAGLAALLRGSSPPSAGCNRGVGAGAAQRPNDEADGVRDRRCTAGFWEAPAPNQYDADLFSTGGGGGSGGGETERSVCVMRLRASSLR